MNRQVIWEVQAIDQAAGFLHDDPDGVREMLDAVARLAWREGAEDRTEEARVLQGVAEDVSAGEEQRRGEDGAGEDDRHNAAGVDLER